MEVRIESMICVWDDKIPALFLEFVNLLTLTTSEGELRKSVKEFAEKHELDKLVPRQVQPRHRIPRAHHRPCEQERQPYP